MEVTDGSETTPMEVKRFFHVYFHGSNEVYGNWWK